MSKNYSLTLRASYLGFITQAITANFAPLLFLTFQDEFSISIAQLGLISTLFYFTQLLIDLFCAKFVDRIGYRRCVVASEVFSAAGLILLAFLPSILPSPYIGVLISVIIYAAGSGLIEVLVSPIIEACPFDHKDAVMSTLHSFYCWGSVGVILLSTLFFKIFGIGNWRILACLWALIPIYNIRNFMICPIERLTDEGGGMTIGELFRSKLFWVMIVLMICAGASELSMSQWASAYTQDALGFEKTTGDLLGPCLFAVTMGIARILYGKFGDRLDLSKFMAGSGLLCLACYLLAALSESPILGLIGCIFCGFSVGIMWPGSISISSVSLPAGGTAMFALLAMAGDMGGSIGPAMVGAVTQASDNFHLGMLSGCVFPAVMVVTLLCLRARKK